MKRIMLLWLVIVLSCTCFSCLNRGEEVSEETVNEYQEELIDYKSFNESISSYEFQNKYKPSGGKVEQYYINIANNDNILQCANKANIDFMTHLPEYVASGQASEEFIGLFNDSDTIEFLPVYGTYLENTSLVVCVFTENNTLRGTKILNIIPYSDTVVLDEPSESFGDMASQEVLSDSTSFNAIRTCIEKYPDFNLLGVVYNTVGYNTVYPIGINSNDNKISFLFSGVTSFRLVDSFDTIGNGRIAFENYWIKKAEVLNSIPVFNWTTETFYENYYFYRYSDANAHYSNMEHLKIHDSFHSFPLLDHNGKEGIYILNLAFYHNDLIGEIILKENDNGELTPVKQIIAQKNDDGQFVPLDNIDYVDSFKLLAQNALLDKTIKGVGFDGNEYCLIYE